MLEKAKKPERYYAVDIRIKENMLNMETIYCSRSYKHTPVYKGDKDRFAKKLANRRIRRRTKRNPYDSLAGKSNHYRKENESWDICDYRHWGEPIWREESGTVFCFKDSDDKDNVRGYSVRYCKFVLYTSSQDLFSEAKSRERRGSIMRREDMIRIFEDTMLLCDTNEILMNKINYSMNHNRVISDENEYDIFKNLIHGHETGKEAKIIVSKKRSFEAASAYKGKHISVLNFASATNPGGGVTKGASAQEECLCRVSTLYKCISASEITEAFHKKHRYALKTGKMNSLYNDDCIQTCDVTVFKSDTAKPALLSERLV